MDLYDDKTAYRTAFSLAVDVNNTCLVGCAGYQLMNNLDFNDADPGMDGRTISPLNGAKTARLTAFQARSSAARMGNTGWAPIGDFSNRFSARFHGNEPLPSATSTSIDGALDAIYGGLFGYADGSTLDSLNLVGVNVNINSIAGSSFGGTSYAADSWAIILVVVV